MVNTEFINDKQSNLKYLPIALDLTKVCLLSLFVCLFGQPANAIENLISVDNFEKLAVGAPWPKVNDTEIIDHCGIGSDSNKCLRVAYKPDWNGTKRLTRNIKIPAYDHYILSYDVMFEDGFEFVQGGKLHGLGPLNPTTGCDATEGDAWSTRITWWGNGMGRNYYYSQNRAEACGTGTISQNQVFAPGEWHHVELDVKLNSKNAEYSGYTKLSVDGEVVSYDQNLQLRSVYNDDSLIQNFMFSTFFGGDDTSWSPSKTVYARFDNFAVKPVGTINSAVQAAIDTTQQSMTKVIAPRLYLKSSAANESNVIQMIGFENVTGGEHTNKYFEQKYTNTDWIIGSSAGRVMIDSTQALTSPGQSLKVIMPAASSSAESGIKWQLGVSPSTSMSLGYWVYFDGDFNFGTGGVLPGIASANQSDSKFWQTSLAWRESGFLNIDIHNSNTYERHKLTYQGTEPRLTKGQWHYIQLKTTVDQNSSHDGMVEVWLDRKKVGDISNLHFASGDTSGKINAVQMNAFLKAGNSSGNEEMWFDDVVISKEPI